MKNGGNYIDREGKDGTVRYLPRSGLLEQEFAPDKVTGHAACFRKRRALAASRPALAGETNVRRSRNLIVERNYNKEGHW